MSVSIGFLERGTCYGNREIAYMVTNSISICWFT